MGTSKVAELKTPKRTMDEFINEPPFGIGGGEEGFIDGEDAGMVSRDLDDGYEDEFERSGFESEDDEGAEMLDYDDDDDY